MYPRMRGCLTERASRARAAAAMMLILMAVRRSGSCIDARADQITIVRSCHPVGDLDVESSYSTWARYAVPGRLLVTDGS
jgi:hypothetical protein